MQTVEINKTDVTKVIHRHSNANLKITVICENKRAEQRLRKSLRGSCRITHASAVNAIGDDYKAILVDCDSLNTSILNQLKRRTNAEELVVYHVK